MASHEGRDKSWYKKWWGVILAILFWPFFLLWFIWSKSKKRTPIKLALTAVIIVLAFVSLGVFAANVPNTTTSDNATPPPQTTPQPKATNVATTKKSTTTTVKPAATPQAPTTAQLIAAWDTKYGYIITSLGTDSGNIGTDATNQDYASLKTDCDQLNTDATTGINAPAIPDATTAQHLSSAFTYYQQAGQQCSSGAQDAIDGTANYDTSQIDKATNEINTATSDMNLGTAQVTAATAAINKLSGH
jgi:hypothetical protein